VTTRLELIFKDKPNLHDKTYIFCINKVLVKSLNKMNCGRVEMLKQIKHEHFANGVTVTLIRDQINVSAIYQ